MGRGAAQPRAGGAWALSGRPFRLRAEPVRAAGREARCRLRGGGRGAATRSLRHRPCVSAARRVTRERACWATGERTACRSCPCVVSPCRDRTGRGQTALAGHLGTARSARNPKARGQGGRRRARALSGHDIVSPPTPHANGITSPGLNELMSRAERRGGGRAARCRGGRKPTRGLGSRVLFCFLLFEPVQGPSREGVQPASLRRDITVLCGV